MQSDQTLEIATRTIESKIGRSLTEVERALLFGAWHDLSFDRIADRSGYSLNYLQRDISPKFWKLLSYAWGRKINKTNLRGIITNFEDRQPPPQSLDLHSSDWGAAIDARNFQGREREIETIARWIVTERCQAIALVGLGGMGKSVLVTRIARSLQGEFEFVIWRSLRNAPSLTTLLTDLVPFLSNQQETKPELAKLLQCWRQSRCLLVLDNLETILDAECAGQFRAGFEEYGELLRSAGEVEHQSCIIFTSREKPAIFATLAGIETTARSLRIDGSPEAARSIVRDKGLQGTEAQQQILADRYSNCPLALKIVSTSIQELFAGNIGDFLAADTFIFTGIRHLLDRQFQRLSPLEQSLMYWLAINREWTTIAELQADITPTIATGRLLEALEALSFRCLIETQGNQFSQQPVVMEYVTDRIIELALDDLDRSIPDFLARYALLKATAKDYIRSAQTQAILAPLVDRLLARYGDRQCAIRHLQQQLSHLPPGTRSDYSAGNYINLLCHLQADLTGADWTGLTIRQAYLAATPLHRVKLDRSRPIQSVFAESITCILGLAFSLDSSILAAIGKTGMLFIYHIPTGQWLHLREAYCGWSFSITFDRQGLTVFTSSVDRAIKQWDVKTGECLRSWETNHPVVYYTSIDPHEKLLASANGDGTIQIWNLQTFDCLHPISAHAAPVLAVDFHPDRPWLVSGGADGTLKLWDYTTQACLLAIDAHTNMVLDCRFHPHGTSIATLSIDGTVKLWSLATKQCLYTFPAGAISLCHALTFSPDGRMLACPRGNAIGVYEVETGKLVRVLPVGRDFWDLKFTPDGKILVSAAHSGQVKFWDVSTWQCQKTIQGGTIGFWSIGLSQREMILASGNEDGRLHVWDLASGRCLEVWREHSLRICKLVCHPHQPLWASCSYDGSIQLWDERDRSTRMLLERDKWVTSIAFHPQQSLLISVGMDGNLRWWDADAGSSIETIALSEPTDLIYDLTIDPRGNLLAGGSESGTIRLWDLATRKIITKISAHQSRVWTLAFHPYRHQLASGGHDGKVKLWGLDTEVAISWEVAGSVMSVAFSPDGKLLAANGDSTIYIWDLATQQCLQTFTAHTNVVSSILFHPAPPEHDYLLISASYDDTIRYWDLDTGECLKILRPDRLYEGMSITEIEGIGDGQKAVLQQLGATGSRSVLQN